MPTEINSRESDGITVELAMDFDNGEMFVNVFDVKNLEAFTIACDPSEAVEIYNHPFAYRDRAFVVTPMVAA